MNQAATLRAVTREPELRIVPLEQARAEWNALAASHPEATLYHRSPWLEVLRRAFGVRPSVAIIGDSASTTAACLLAQGNPIRRSLISLPFSDFCPPLALNDSARVSLLSELAALGNMPRLELRGVAGNHPWHVAPSLPALDARFVASVSSDRIGGGPRSAASSPSRTGGRRDGRVRARRRGDGFLFQSSAREPAAARSSVAAAQAFQNGARGLCETRCDRSVVARRIKGKRIAAVVVLRDGDVLHAKWSARVAGSPDGASHMIFMAIAEHHAQRASSLDFGRTDSRNRGLSRFKRELGAAATDLPYSYFPRRPAVTSAENLTGVWQTASRVWRNLPLPVARVLNHVTYRYLA